MTEHNGELWTEALRYCGTNKHTRYGIHSNSFKDLSADWICGKYPKDEEPEPSYSRARGRQDKYVCQPRHKIRLMAADTHTHTLAHSRTPTPPPFPLQRNVTWHRGSLKAIRVERISALLNCPAASAAAARAAARGFALSVSGCQCLWLLSRPN